MQTFVERHLEGRAPGRAWVIGTARRADPLDAALLGGTAGTWLELDEGNLFAHGHPGIQVVPGAVALAQQLGSSGADLLRAVALGYEVSSRVSRATATRIAVHPHGTYGVIGTAVAAACLRGFSAAQMLEVLNVSATMGMASSRQTLLDGATVLSKGSFRLDRRRAFEKLSHHQLEDPHRYTLELVAAAVCAGATKITVVNDSDDFEIEWDGDHPTAEELEALLDWIFTRSDDRRARMLQHLSQGLFGAVGLDPRWVHLERPGVKLTLTDPLEPTQAPSPRTEGVRVHVRERFSWKVLREGLSRPFDAVYETKLLRRYAWCCPVPIVIAGGKKLPELEALEMAYNACQAGAAGVDMGRNIFQSDCPVGMIQAVNAVVHENETPKQAIKIYEHVKNEIAKN
jgi:hypothetical protein